MIRFLLAILAVSAVRCSAKTQEFEFSDLMLEELRIPENFGQLTQGKAVVAKTYEVNLDLPPKQRWTSILKKFNRQMFLDGMDSIIDPILKYPLLIKLAEDIASRLDEILPQPYADELRGIAEFMNVKLGKVVIINLAYDLSAFAENPFFSKACTSIVAVDENGNLIHGRNMDYHYTEFLSNVTVNVLYKRKGRVLYTGTTFAGYIGFLTGRKMNAFSISGDERDQGRLIDNIIGIVEHHWPTLIMARQVVDTAETYEEALDMLVKAKSIAPMYFILGGVEPHQGAVIVHGRDRAANVTTMEENHGWYVVETNYEPWEPAPHSDDRRDAAIRAMDSVGRDNMNPQQLLNVLSTDLVFNAHTVYTTVMSTVDENVYTTYVRWDRPGNA